MKKYFQKIWEWMKKHPKKVYQYIMILLLLSFVFFILEVIWFEPKISRTPVPSILKKSDTIMTQIDAQIDNELDRKKNIVKELKYLQNKELLQKSDSLRIEFLLNKCREMKIFTKERTPSKKQ